MKQYADYKFYQDVYCGNTISDETQFKRLAIDASFFLNELTFGRIKEPYSDEVKMATCAVADIGYRELKENSEEQIASESVGPHSISYVKKNKSTEEYAKEKIRTVQMYLSSTGLLYRGLASCIL